MGQGGENKAREMVLEGQPDLSHMLALPLISCVTLGEFLNPSVTLCLQQ